MTDIKQKNKISTEDKNKIKDVGDNIQQQRGGEVYSKTGVRDRRENEPHRKKEIKKDAFNKDNKKLREENKKALTKSGEEYNKDNKIG